MSRRPSRTALAGALLLATALTACASPQALIGGRENDLAAAGFLVRPANTPERQAMLARLPPNQMVQEMRGGTVTYVYADPVVCQCLYVGSQQAFAAFQRFRQQQQLATQQELTAMTYQDTAWNWGPWGPWGPGWNPAFGFGPGW